MNQIILKDKIHQFKEWIISKDEDTNHIGAHLELVKDWQSVVSVIRMPGLKTYQVYFGTSHKLWPLYFFYMQHYPDEIIPTVEDGMKLVEKLLVRYNKLLCFA